jgi:hypothetical protein
LQRSFWKELRRSKRKKRRKSRFSKRNSPKNIPSSQRHIPHMILLQGIMKDRSARCRKRKLFK